MTNTFITDSVIKSEPKVKNLNVANTVKKKRKTSLLMVQSLHISEKGSAKFKSNRNEMITYCKLQ